MRDDGMCYADAPVDDTAPDDDTPDEEPPTLEDVLEALPACEPGSTDGRLDVYAGCADGICAGMTFDEMVDALGPELYCYSFYYDFGGSTNGSVSCGWRTGHQASFEDGDLDGVPDAGSPARAISLDDAFDGGTTTGLGIGANMTCFLDELGDPETVEFRHVDKGWALESASWPTLGVYVYDRSSRSEYTPDGFVDALSLYGPQETGEL